MRANDNNLLSCICNAETGKTPARAALPKKVDWNLTPSSSLNAINCKVQENEKRHCRSQLNVTKPHNYAFYKTNGPNWSHFLSKWITCKIQEQGKDDIKAPFFPT